MVEGKHSNHILISRIMAVLLNGWILPIGEVSLVEGV